MHVVVCGVLIFGRLSRPPDGGFVASYKYNSRDASPTMMWRFGTPSWVKPTSVPGQQLIYPLGETLRYLSCSAYRTQGSYATLCHVDDW